MTETLGVAEAKRRFSELLDRVRAGERFVIARRGKPDAVLAPPDGYKDPPEQPLGLLAFIGAMEDFPEFEQVMDEVIKSRRGSKDRDVPYFDDWED